MESSKRPQCGQSARARAARAEVHRGYALAAGTPEERFCEAYRAARLSAAALLPRSRPRRGGRGVWQRLGAEVAGMEEWAEAFSGYSRLFAAVEDRLPRAVSQQMADDFLWAVDRFLDVTDDRLGLLGPAA